MIQEPTSRFPSGLPLLGKMDAVVTQPAKNVCTFEEEILCISKGI